MYKLIGYKVVDGQSKAIDLNFPTSAEALHARDTARAKGWTVAVRTVTALPDVVAVDPKIALALTSL